MLGREANGALMIEHGVTRSQLGEEGGHTALEFFAFCRGQARGSFVHEFRPLAVINAGDIYVVLKNAFLNGLQDCGTLVLVE